MKYTKKYLVVPYVNTLEKPAENEIQNLDKNMTDVITDKNLADDSKMKLYSQNLNRFLLKYDPNSYGVTPTIAKLAQVVSDYLENNNSPQKLEQDLMPLFVKTDESSNNSSLNSPRYMSKLPFNPHYYNIASKDMSLLETSVADKTAEVDTSQYIAQTSKKPTNKKKQEDPIFDEATKPTKNTRSHGPATHHEGVQDPKKFAFGANNKPMVRTPNNQNPEFNASSKKSVNKYKDGKSKKQSGSGMWLTKKFF